MSASFCCCLRNWASAFAAFSAAFCSCRCCLASSLVAPVATLGELFTVFDEPESDELVLTELSDDLLFETSDALLAEPLSDTLFDDPFDPESVPEARVAEPPPDELFVVAVLPPLPAELFDDPRLESEPPDLLLAPESEPLDDPRLAPESELLDRLAPPPDELLLDDPLLLEPESELLDLLLELELELEELLLDELLLEPESEELLDLLLDDCEPESLDLLLDELELLLELPVFPFWANTIELTEKNANARAETTRRFRI